MNRFDCGENDKMIVNKKHSKSSESPTYKPVRDWNRNAVYLYKCNNKIRMYCIFILFIYMYK